MSAAIWKEPPDDLHESLAGKVSIRMTDLPGRTARSGALDIETWIDRGRAVVQVGGEVDVYSVPMLRETLQRIEAPRPLRIAVIMSDVTFLDSAGIGVLIGALKRARATDGKVALVGCSANVDRMLRMMGLNRVFGLYANLDDAFSYFGKQT